MFIEKIKEAIEKFKYKFKGPDNREYELKEKEEVESEEVKVNIEEVRRAANTMQMHFEVQRLRRILARVKKVRVKKKLIGRITRLIKSYQGQVVR